MNREIKFRGKRIDNGEWVYGYYIRIQNDDSSYTHYIQEDTTRHIKNVSQTLYEVTPESVGQYTGRKDKNGKEVYEGDGLEYWTDHQVGYPLDKRPQRHVKIIEIKNLISGCFLYSHYSYQIIGNIYENPELLNS